MPDYNDYTFDDFVLDIRFRQWALTDSPTEQVFWNDWLQAHPDKLDLVLAARQFVVQMHQVQNDLTDDELDSELSRLKTARQQVSHDKESASPRRFWGGWYWAAASILLVCLGGWLYWTSLSATTPLAVFRQSVRQQAGLVQEAHNETSVQQWVRLPDGSRVLLYKDGRISFPTRFMGGQRTVFLVGEAFFEVVRRPKQPFLVYTNHLTTKVLGTSFTVRAYDTDKEAKVIVRTGKVSVFTTSENLTPGKPANKEPAFILTPNQQVTFDPQARQLTRSLVAAPLPLPTAGPGPQTVVFDRTPVVDVFRKLESTYGIIINYDADLLANCELTAEFDTESLYEQLDLICRATESRYEIIDAQIIVYSNGCFPVN